MYAVTTLGNKNPLLFERGETTSGKPHQLHSETAVTRYPNPSTVYEMWCDNTWKATSIALRKRGVTTSRKSHQLCRETAGATYTNPSTAY